MKHPTSYATNVGVPCSILKMRYPSLRGLSLGGGYPSLMQMHCNIGSSFTPIARCHPKECSYTCMGKAKMALKKDDNLAKPVQCHAS